MWHDVAGLDGAVTRRRLWESWAVTSLVSHTRVVSGECPVAATISAHHSANNPPGCSGPCGPGGRVPPRCAATPSTTPPPSPLAGVWRSRRCAAGLWLGLATGSTGSLLGAVRRPAGTSGAPRPIGWRWQGSVHLYVKSATCLWFYSGTSKMPRSQCCHVRGYGDTRQAGYSQGGHTGSTTAGGWNSGEHEIIENNQLNDLRYFKPTWTLNLICVRLFFFTLTLAFTGVLCLCTSEEMCEDRGDTASSRGRGG